MRGILFQDDIFPRLLNTGRVSPLVFWPLESELGRDFTKEFL